MQFRYIVFTKTGQMVTGVTEAPSEQVAEEALWRAGYIIAKMEAVRPLPSLRDLLRTLFAVKRQDLIIFSRQLATLLGSGVAILPALQLLADQVGNPTLRRALRQIAEDIQAGASISANPQDAGSFTICCCICRSWAPSTCAAPSPAWLGPCPPSCAPACLWPRSWTSCCRPRRTMCCARPRLRCRPNSWPAMASPSP